MPSDRLLGTLLRSLQSYTEQQDTPRLLATAASLLTTLNNPLNLTLLTSQLLFAPAIWARPDGLRTCVRCLGAFHSAAQALLRHEDSLREQSSDHDFAKLQYEPTLPKDDWIRAVVSGADEHSPRWRHLLVLGGLLQGFGPAHDQNLSRSMRSTLESGLVTAINVALGETLPDDELGQQAVTAVLNYCFPDLPDHERARLDYDSLLPVLMRSTLHYPEGFRSAYFLGTVDNDVRAVSGSRFQWSARSSSYQQIHLMLSSPIVSSLGPLARLIGHTAEQARDPRLIMAALDDLEAFARTLYLQWRHTKLSEIDSSEESMYLDTETMETTSPALWKLLRSTLFAVVIILRSIVGRILGDAALAIDDGIESPVASKFAAQTLHTLRYFHFISSRLGITTFSQYSFVYLTTMDILATYPSEAEAFLEAIKPADIGQVPHHPLDRSLDLFYLNTAEHFTLVLPQSRAEELLVAVATPYLAAGGNNHLLTIFEAAHSVMLAAFSAPQNVELTAKHLPFYVDALFKVFPSNLSARQFRLAFKTLLGLATPPSELAANQPMLPTVLLELLHDRAYTASSAVIPLDPPSTGSQSSPYAAMELSEQAVLVLTVIDTLPQLPLELLEEWLPLAAGLMNHVADASIKERCKEHFWSVLMDGEMSSHRSQACAAWWSTGGGRDMVLFGHERGEEEVLEMSGALPLEASHGKL
ncbi:hypothetical protein LTR91_020690 [Friedmanniomyces endolithicus]|uniref:Peroxisomal membrane protein PEX17 n=2 Tax=Dothideomycetidae TaxID=451867 RepID=A0AAN6H992_9PEZI|nr:hypothetical protein LTR75_015161 [Friedmanniomyces endolithicus]KAK5144638.1 hypothetical protein LTR32_003484 [Rachicladosporium monterosium]KAK0897460.1 hypothetical protein LTR57_022108 [Friedmanniomyces endolithicus]KAK0897567.1 hypothetical protein LTR02_010620 [Friedmanniomyces endolithicus]KAK0940015.1 hypothetical protein LTR29_008350 [Friedmanniomyces endolithicus]